MSRLNSILPALRLAAQSDRPYRLAVIDTSIAGMGGLSLGRTIHDDPRTHKTVLVALSSDPANEAPRLYAEGFAGIVEKPPKPLQMKQVLLEALRHGRPQKAPPAVVAMEMKKASEARAIPAPTAVAVPLPPPSAGLVEAKILLAEDNLVNQKIALRLLEKAGLCADLAKNGREAVEAVRKSNYDPHSDGLSDAGDGWI